MTGLGGGAASLNRHSGGGFAGYNEPLLSNGTGIMFLPYDGSGGYLVGYLGPTKSNLRSDYKSVQGWGTWVDDDANFNTTTTGIQVWHAPETRSYTFLMETAKFHVNGYGLGRKLQFDYNLTAGDRLFILPGHRCHPTPDSNSSHGGNGGCFLVMGDNTEPNLDTDLYNRVKSDVIAVCGGAGKANGGKGDATTPGSHPSGGDDETTQNNGSGRSLDQYHGFSGAGGPSGGAGFLKGACQHDASGTTHFRYTDKQDSTSFIYDADSFVRGGLGGRGYNHTMWNDMPNAGQGNNGMNGSGGFGGGGGQSTGNSYNSGAGGYQGGNESDGSNHYPSNHKYSNGADRHCGGGSFVKSGLSLTTNTTATGSVSYVKVTYT